MIEDAISNHALYRFGPVWQTAFDFIRSLGADEATGRRVLSSDGLYAGIDVYATKMREAAKLETHQKHVDIQLLLSGREIIDVYPRASLTISEPYDPARDATFYRVPSDPAPVRVLLTPGRFVVLFPDDAHMPCLAAGPVPEDVRKVVVKVPVGQLGI